MAFKIINGDITKINADAIVNISNSNFGLDTLSGDVG